MGLQGGKTADAVERCKKTELCKLQNVSFLVFHSSWAPVLNAGIGDQGRETKTVRFKGVERKKTKKHQQKTCTERLK